MKLARTLAALTIAGSTALAFTSAPAMSAPLMRDSGLRSPAVASGIEHVQWRGHRHGWHGHRHGWRHHHHHRGYGWGPAIGGLAAGAIIGGAIANSQASANEVAYCSRRFKSYDPASGTYLGYDGLRHPCP